MQSSFENKSLHEDDNNYAAPHLNELTSLDIKPTSTLNPANGKPIIKVVGDPFALFAKGPGG
jgi:hypothetical protein